MKNLYRLSVVTLICFLPSLLHSQIFEKVTDSPLLTPIEAYGGAWGD